MIYQKYAIKKALKGMTRKERTRGVQEIMKGIKGPTTYRGLKKALAEEGLSLLARKRILGKVKTGAMPQLPQKPSEEKIAREGWKVDEKIKPKEKVIRPKEWMKETGRMGIKFEKERKPLFFGQKFAKTKAEVRQAKPETRQFEKPFIKPEIPQKREKKYLEQQKLQEKHIQTASELDKKETEEEDRVGRLLEEKFKESEKTEEETTK